MNATSDDAEQASFDRLTYDSDAVRRVYRRTIQRGTALFSAACVLNAGLQWWVQDPLWWCSLVLSVVCLPIIPLCTPERNFRWFFAGLLTISAIIVFYYSFMGFRYGAEAAYHLKLLVAVPVLTMAGRIGIAVKRIALVALVLAFVILDAEILASGSQVPLTELQTHVLRAINVGLTLCNLAILLMHYFRLVAEQQVLLEAYATTDPLSGLVNRRHLAKTWMPIQAAMVRHHVPVSVAICDIDHFKSINDRFGHDAGDKVIRRVGRLLKDSLRTKDCACRWGGEEFLLLMPHSNLREAEAGADRIRRRIAEEQIALESGPITATATFGVVQIRPGESLEAAVARADQALYAGKKAGRNRVISEDAMPSSTTAV